MLVRAKREKTTGKEETVGGTLTADTSPNSNARSFYFVAHSLFCLPVSLLFPVQTIGLVSFTLPVPHSLDETFATMRPFTYKCPLAMDILASPSRHRISSYRSIPFFPSLLTDFTIPFSSTRLVSLTKAPVIKQVSRLDISR